MLGLLKKRKLKPLHISMKSLINIIEKDYTDGYEFNLVEFNLDNSKHLVGSEMDEEEQRIVFVYDGKDYSTIEELKKAIVLNGKNLYENDVVVEITRACIIGNEAAISSPWKEARLAEHAVF